MFFLLCALGLCFEVHDEDLTIELKSGQSTVKYISLYNFAPSTANIVAELLLYEYPEPQRPAYQIDLAGIKDDKISIKSDKKILFPIYINAYKRLPKGRYLYWLKLAELEYELKKEDIGYKKFNTYKLPLIIVVK